MAEGTTMGSLTLTTRTEGNAVILTASGDVDLSGSPLLRQELKKHAGKKIVVDLSAVPYMDSSGLATLVEAMQSSRKGGGQLFLCALGDRVRSIFSIAKLESVFKIVPSVEAALAA